jgi:hypothetical protein
MRILNLLRGAQLMKLFLFLTTLAGTLAHAGVITDFDETKIQAPLKESNEQALIGTICKTRVNAQWNVCFNKFENNEEQMKSFTFTNWGENKIVPKSGFGIGRSFEFMFEDLARSDLGLLIWDMPDETESHGHLKLMMFFPRQILPSIRNVVDSDKDIMIVTLPTKEEVVFDTNTKEVISGVLKEDQLKQDKEGNALNPDVMYNGSGVVIEADRLNDYPVGLAAQSGKNNMATIRKKGFKDCKIAVKDLWYTDENKGGNVFFNKKYVTDKALDQLLQTKCRFSMFK